MFREALGGGGETAWLLIEDEVVKVRLSSNACMHMCVCVCVCVYAYACVRACVMCMCHCMP